MYNNKYHIDCGQVRDTATGEYIPETEPVFLLRAKDRHSVPLIAQYLERRIADAHRQPFDDRVLLEQQLAAHEKWRVERNMPIMSYAPSKIGVSHVMPIPPYVPARNAVKLQRTVDHQNARIKNLSAEVASCKAKLSERDGCARVKIEERDATIAERDTTIAELREVIAARDNHIDACRADIAMSNKVIDEQRNDILNKTYAIDDCGSVVENLRSTLKKSVDELKATTRAFDVMRRARDGEKVAVCHLQGDVARLMGERDAAHQTLNDHRKQFDILGEENRRLRAELDSYYVAVGSLSRITHPWSERMPSHAAVTNACDNSAADEKIAAHAALATELEKQRDDNDALSRDLKAAGIERDRLKNAFAGASDMYQKLARKLNAIADIVERAS